MVDAGDGSIIIEHKDLKEIKKDTISTDTTIKNNNQINSPSTDTIASQSYSPFENIINDPSSPDQVEQNIEYMEVQIKRSTEPKSLMLIAASENCNTYLIINIAKNLKTSGNLTEKRKETLIQLFKKRLTQEFKSNSFNDEIDEILKE